MGPLGHGFPLKCDGSALLVGGGFGVAPLYFLARRLKELGQPNDGAIVLFVGGRTKNDLLALDRFEALGGVKVHLATNDGSAGAKGLVTDPLDDELIRLRGEGGEFELFACGPDPMLKAVALRATGTGSKGWISMDRHMVCGVGACYACIQKTVRGNSRCCIEGPVFSAADQHRTDPGHSPRAEDAQAIEFLHIVFCVHGCLPYSFHYKLVYANFWELSRGNYDERIQTTVRRIISPSHEKKALPSEDHSILFLLHFPITSRRIRSARRTCAATFSIF